MNVRLALSLSLLLSPVALAQSSDLSTDALVERFARQKQQSEWGRTTARHLQLGGTLELSGSEVEGAQGNTLRAGDTEVRMLRFEDQAAADAYLVHGDLEQIVPHPMVFEQRGSYVAVYSGPDARDPQRALETLRQVWNAEVYTSDTHLIPPVRTRAAYVDGATVVETAIEDETFVASYDSAAYSGIPTEHSEGIRRIHAGDGAEAYGRAFRLTPSDTNPLRSRADVGKLGMTRSFGVPAAPKQGLTDRLTGN